MKEVYLFQFHQMMELKHQMSWSCSDCAAEKNYEADDNSFEPQNSSHDEMNDLIRDPSFARVKAEQLASRLKEKYLLEYDVSITGFQRRNVFQKRVFLLKANFAFTATAMDF